MPRAKDAKTISKRIDLHYFKKAGPLRSVRGVLSVLAVVAVGAWFAYAYTNPAAADRLYNPGPVTAAHASFENNCAACHVPNGNGQFLRAVADNACLQCHEAAAHHPNQLARAGANAQSPFALAYGAEDLARAVAAGSGTVDPERAEAMLRAAGPVALPAVHQAVKSAGANEPGKERLRALAEQLTKDAVQAVSQPGDPPGVAAAERGILETGPDVMRAPLEEARAAAGADAKAKERIERMLSRLDSEGGTPPWVKPSRLQVPLTSAQCIACHVEHRGHDALAAVSDTHCTQCHANVAGTAANPVRIANSVTNFSLTGHPRFTPDVADASDLAARAAGGVAAARPAKPAAAAAPWTDPTDLKFNHKLHLADAKINNNCALCHVTADPNALALVGGDPKSYNPRAKTQLPMPFAPDSLRPPAWSNSDEGAYMRPVSFEQHCVMCHELKLPGGIVLPHERMDVVRNTIQSLPAAYLQILASMPEEERNKELAKKGGGAGAGRRPRRGGGAAAEPAKMTEAEWVAKELTELAKGAKMSDKGFKDLEKELAPVMLPLGDEKKPTFHPALVEYYVANKTCAKCHSVEGEPMKFAVASLQVFGGGAAAAPAPAPPPAAGETPEAAPPAGDAAEPTPKPKRRPPRRGGGGASGAVDQSDDGAAPVLLAADTPRRRPPRRRPGGAEAETPPAGEQPAGAAAPAPAGEGAAPAAPGPSTPPVDPSKLLRTTPTGVPDAPRRWFAQSRFDHRAHRNMTCVECHSDLGGLERYMERGSVKYRPFTPKSIDALEDDALREKLTAVTKDTGEVLVPDVQWKIDVFQNVGTADEPKFRRVGERLRGCVDCHRPDTSQQRFAPNTCVTCHDYHDHSKELWPDGSPFIKPSDELIQGIVLTNAPPPAAAPAAETPAEPPAEETPAEGESTETPAEETPTEETPTEETPADPVEAAPEGETPPADATEAAPAEESA